MASRDASAARKRQPITPRYYTRVEYDEMLWDDGEVEQIEYDAIREAPEADSENRSHEIARAHGKHWADKIVAALNAEVRRERRRKK